MNTLEIENRNWIFAYSEGHSMLLNELFFSAFTNYPEIPGILKEILYINKDSLQVCYTPKSEIERVREQGKIFFSAVYRRNFENNISKCAQEFSLFWDEYKKVGFSKISNEKLLEIFKRYMEHLEPMLAYYQVSGGRVYPVLEEYVKEKMANLFKNEDLEKMYAIALTSTDLDLIEREEIALLKLSDRKKITKDDIFLHSQNYAYSYLCTYDDKRVISSLRKRIIRLKKEYRNYKNYFFQHSKLKKEILKEQRKIMNKIKDKRVTELIKFLRNQGKIRFDYKEWFFGAEYKFLNIFKEISKRIGLSIKDYMGSYRIEDTLSFLQNNKKLSKSEIKKRRKIFVFLQLNKKKYFYVGEKAKQIEKKILSSRTNLLKEVKGVIANTGVAVGRAKIILPKSFEYLEKEMKTFNKGDILITPMTQPNLLMIMKKATAIVTNQGGITSHAAVLSRELGIPCVINTLTATEVFKNGDLVEVDADKGIVKIIKKS